MMTSIGNVLDLGSIGIDYSWLAKLIGMLHGGTVSKWAVVCVCFEDDPRSLPPLDLRQKLFTRVGNGTMNMPDFFSDMSHGRLNLDGSKVFGWYRLSQRRGDYVGNTSPQPTGKLNRDGLRDAARALAAADIAASGTTFDGVVVSAYGRTDLCGWVGDMAALCDDNSLQPSLLGQEMGHGYGLDHARRDGSYDDYRDPWDVMSTAAYPDYEAVNDNYQRIGPGLNAWSMRSRGWLDESRVWSGPYGGFDSVVTLRPLHHRDLPGYLAAEVGQYLVEFRVRERWDAAIPRAAVLVHRFDGNHPYLMSAVSGGEDLVKGDRFESGPSNAVLSPHVSVSVLDIDEDNYSAALQLSWRPPRLPRDYDMVGRLVGGVAVDGNGGLIVNGVYHPVPPRGPENLLLGAFAQYLSTNVTASVAAGTQLKRDLIREVVRQALTLHASLEDVSESPPNSRGEEG
jgi:hypothetical protein